MFNDKRDNSGVLQLGNKQLFVSSLEVQNDFVEKFDTDLWCGLMNFVTVHSKDNVQFTFKDGTDIQA